MILITGACASGKRAYAQTLGYSREIMVAAAKLEEAGLFSQSLQVGASNDTAQSGGCCAERPSAVHADGVASCSYCKTKVPVVYDVQELACIPRCDLEELASWLERCDVVICTEMGCGIVPFAREDREWRERAGRLSCLLAQRARAVVRMVCGIPVFVKGQV